MDTIDTATNGTHPVTIETLISSYRDRVMSPLALGHAFLEYRQANKCPQKKLSRLTGITAGTIHHYESLIGLVPELKAALNADRLTFKEARALADLPRHRQREYAAPFISGELSSMHVERFVSIAKGQVGWSVEALTQKVLLASGQRLTTNSHRSKSIPPKQKHQYDGVTLVEIIAHVVNLAAELEMLGLRELSQIDRLRLGQSLRILRTRMANYELPA